MEDEIVRSAMSRAMTFVLVTYLPLQLIAVLVVRGMVWRCAATLPLIVMLPVIYGGFNPAAYRNGSLYGIVYYVTYAPAMVCLAIVCLVGIGKRFARIRRLKGAGSSVIDEDVEAAASLRKQEHVLFFSCAVLLGVLLLLLLLPFR